MRRKFIFIGVVFLLLFLITSSVGFCQEKEEKEERSLNLLQLHRFLLPYKFSPRVGAFAGFDSNVNLSNTRKGDVFEEFILSVGFSKPWLENIKWSEGIKFIFNYDLDVLNYNEITDASNILNHLNFALQKRYKPFLASVGYDLGILYYPNNEDGDFLIHKAFLSLRQNIFKKLYHQLRLENSFKQYTNKEAIAEMLGTQYDEKRHDYRYSLEYSLGSNLNRSLFLKWSGKYSINESNAIYLDFYDYVAYETALTAEYKIAEALSLYSKFSYNWKNYARTVTLRDYKQKDNLYAGTLGLTYQLNKNNSLTTYYTYRENSSNDYLEEYFEHVFSGGWRYSF